MVDAASIEAEAVADRVEHVLTGEEVLLLWPVLLEVYYITRQEQGRAKADRRYAPVKQLPAHIQWDMEEATLLTAGRLKAVYRLIPLLDKGRRSVYNWWSMDIVDYIPEQIKAENYEFSIHAEQEREDEHILVEELEQSVASGELLEDYTDDPRGHSCLILGLTRDGRAVHSVWGLLPGGRVRVITVYIPMPPKWIDPRTRRSGV